MGLIYHDVNDYYYRIQIHYLDSKLDSYEVIITYWPRMFNQLGEDLKITMIV